MLLHRNVYFSTSPTQVHNTCNKQPVFMTPTKIYSSVEYKIWPRLLEASYTRFIDRKLLSWTRRSVKTQQSPAANTKEELKTLLIKPVCKTNVKLTPSWLYKSWRLCRFNKTIQTQWKSLQMSLCMLLKCLGRIGNCT